MVRREGGRPHIRALNVKMYPEDLRALKTAMTRKTRLLSRTFTIILLTRWRHKVYILSRRPLTKLEIPRVRFHFNYFYEYSVHEYERVSWSNIFSGHVLNFIKLGKSAVIKVLGLGGISCLYCVIMA